MEVSNDQKDVTSPNSAWLEFLSHPAVRRNIITDKLKLGTLEQIFGAEEAAKMCEPDVFDRARESAIKKIYGRRITSLL